MTRQKYLNSLFDAHSADLQTVASTTAGLFRCPFCLVVLAATMSLARVGK